MNKTCARCEKTVYPTEELKCLDKVWHKGCFKCQECGMTLNMRTYKGYGKLPYCEAHVPKAKHTTMAETPELKRIAENTKLQSNVKYHADFEKSKGKFTQVADDPETLRIKANTKIISNVAYHGELEKKAQMEKQRQINENGEFVDPTSDNNYHQQLETYATEMLPPPNLPQKSQYTNPQPQPNQNPRSTPPNQDYYRPQQQQQQQKYENDFSYNPPPPQYANPPSHPPQNSYPQYPNQNHPNAAPYTNYQQYSQPQYTPPPPAQYQSNNYSAQTNQYQKYEDQYYGVEYQQGMGNPQQKIGRIQDYDPMSDGPRQAPSTQRASTTVIYKSNDGRPKGANNHQQQQSSRPIGRVTDMDPLAEEQSRPRVAQQPAQKVYIAMYDYEANDSDEVSFHEGDLISNVTSIDSGWMTGQVLRTGRTGMLPANYVELAPNNRN